MQKNINFISSQTQQKIKTNRLLRSILVFLSSLLAIVLVLYCVSIPVILSMKIKTKNIENKIDVVKKDIDKNRELESMLLTAKSRSLLTGSLINRENDLVYRYLDLVTLLFERGYRLKSNLDARTFGVKIEVEGDIPNAPSLKEIGLLMNDLKSNKYITGYEVNSISRLKTGSYQAVVTLN